MTGFSVLGVIKSKLGEGVSVVFQCFYRVLTVKGFKLGVAFENLRMTSSKGGSGRATG